ncbi:hypothetical protein FOZ63_022690, partial [Perkinsus olseni]
DTEKAVVVKRLAEEAESFEVFERRGEQYEKSVTPREKRKPKRGIARTPSATDEGLFDAAGVLKSIGKVMEANPRRSLPKFHKEKKVQWTKDYMKTDFAVQETDGSRATLDGPDG